MPPPRPDPRHDPRAGEGAGPTIAITHLPRIIKTELTAAMIDARESELARASRSTHGGRRTWHRSSLLATADPLFVTGQEFVVDAFSG